jgi:hypothetical protein
LESNSFADALRLEDSGKGSWYEVLTDAVLAEPAPLNVAKKNVTHRVKECSQSHGKVFVEVGLPAILK